MHTFRSRETTSSNNLSDIPIDPWSTQSSKPATSDNHKCFALFYPLQVDSTMQIKPLVLLLSFIYFCNMVLTA